MKLPIGYSLVYVNEDGSRVIYVPIDVPETYPVEEVGKRILVPALVTLKHKIEH